MEWPLSLPELSRDALWEILLSSATFLLIFGYHLSLVKRVRQVPLQTAIGITNHVRQQWVRSIMHNKSDLLAVQTLRNGVMASNFLASTAILIDLGLLSVVFKPSFFQEVSYSMSLVGTHNQALWLFKLMVLVVLFFYAFFNFTLTIRYYNHAGFMINILEAHDPTVTPEVVAEALNLGALHYTLGMRGFYLAVPLGLWMFGPLWMFCGAVILVLVLNKLDRTA
ncbi:MAG: DUF599 domain-containing protein [Desulfobacteraceae bacterium]|nr:DUF599 domain-containing protein [Desulfobacteraceae bacterium]